MFRQTLHDSFFYNAALGTFIMSTLYKNPEIWAHDYPPDIKEKFGPRSQQAKQQAVILAIPFFGIMLGGTAWSNYKLKQKNDGFLSFKAAFLNAYALILSGWLFDLTILDWFIFVRHTPDFVVLPGTEGMAGYDDYRFHLKEHLRALPLLTALALLIALVTASRKHTPSQAR